MPSKSNSQTRSNNAIPQPSMYSVYFSGEQQAARYDLSKHVSELSYDPDTE